MTSLAEIRAAYPDSNMTDSSIASPAFHLGALHWLVAQKGDERHEVSLQVLREALRELDRTKAALRWVRLYGNDPAPPELADRCIAAVNAELVAVEEDLAKGTPHE